MKNSIINISRILDTSYSLHRKLVSRNSKNSYISTSLSTSNTSRKDGLLVCKDSQYSESYQVLLSHIDEVIMNNACYYQLGFHKYPGCFFPNGLKYISKIEQDSQITFYYAVSNLLLKKELFLAPNKAELTCVYTLEEGEGEIDIVLKPFVAFRNIYSLNKAHSKKFTVTNSANNIKISESKDYPDLYINCSKKMIFTEKSDWYYDFEYQEDKLVGKEYKEDLFLPGQILVSLRPHEQFSLTVGIEKNENYDKYKYNNECLHENESQLTKHCDFIDKILD